MILAFLVPVILFALLLIKKKKLVRKDWYILFCVGLVFAVSVSLVSVWSAWSPYTMSDSLHGGNYSGASVLSFPTWMNVYITPLNQRSDNGMMAIANVSFDVSIANEDVLEKNGTLEYMLVFCSCRVDYQLGSPFFSDAVSFFGFLILIFALINLVGFALGMILCFTLSRAIESRSIDHVP